MPAPAPALGWGQAGTSGCPAPAPALAWLVMTCIMVIVMTCIMVIMVMIVMVTCIMVIMVILVIMALWSPASACPSSGAS